MKQSDQQPRPAEADASDVGDSALQGEGNYKVARRFGESVKRFLDKGKVDDAARDAAPRSAEDEHEMKAAEDTGLSRERH